MLLEAEFLFPELWLCALTSATGEPLLQNQAASLSRHQPGFEHHHTHLLLPRGDPRRKQTDLECREFPKGGPEP